MTKNYLSDDDKALFRRTVRSIKPFDKDTATEWSADISGKKQHKTHHLSCHSFESVTTDAILNFNHHLPPKRMQQLKRGLIPWQSQLDLHGFTSSDACDLLCDFIEKHYQLGERSLLIIHGKGSPDGALPILKNLVNSWLQQLPQVLAFHSALPRDGGGGAVYVLLKRQR